MALNTMQSSINLPKVIKTGLYHKGLEPKSVFAKVEKIRQQNMPSDFPTISFNSLLRSFPETNLEIEILGPFLIPIRKCQIHLYIKA